MLTPRTAMYFNSSPSYFLRLKRLCAGGAFLLAMGMPIAAGQTAYVSVEPNQNKFEATPAPGMVAGDSLEAYECPSSVIHNVFRVGTAPAPLAIYQHRFSMASPFGGPFNSMQVQGRDAIDDLALPQSVEILADSADLDQVVATPFVAWYGFGKSEELYVDFAGVSGCRAGTPSATVLSTAVVAPTVLTPVQSASLGGRRLHFAASGVGSNVDTELQIFDSEFNALYASGSDDRHSFSVVAELTANLSDGRYYIAVSDHELATHLPPSTLWAESKNPSSAMDFRGGAVNGSAEFPLDLTFRISDFSTGISETVPFTKSEPFQVTWLQLDVGSSQASASFCAGDGSLAPCPACSSDAPLGSGTGCRNSTGRGAALTFFREPGFGSTGPNLLLEGIPSGTAALIFVSAGTVAPVEIGGGLFCLQLGAYRQPIVTGRLDGMARLSIETSTFPVSMLGQTVYAQALYRDAGAPCALNVSSGTSFILW